MKGLAARVSPSTTAARGGAGGLAAAGAPARQHYIDWLRVLAVLLLFPFHTLRVFNADDPFYVKAAHLSGVVSDVLNFISVWHMPLLFVLAGASTFFALGRRSAGRYLRERRARLLLPFLFGFLVLIPPQTWYGGRFNSGYTGSFVHYLVSGDFLKWNIRDGGDYYGGFGIGHLWFIIVLFLIAVVALPLLAWGRTERGGAVLRGLSRRLAHPAGWALAAALLLVGSALPDPTGGLQPLYYLVFFVLGYLAVCDGAFIERAVRYRLPSLTIGVTLSIWWVLAGDRLQSAQPNFSPQSAALALLGMLAAWTMIVGLLGYGKRHLDRTSPALAYLAEGSYPVYIIHQTVIVIAAFYVVRLAAAEPLQWLTLIVVSVVVTFALYEVVRRVPVARVLFGMRPLRRPPAAGAAAAPTTVAPTAAPATTAALPARSSGK